MTQRIPGDLRRLLRLLPVGLLLGQVLVGAVATPAGAAGGYLRTPDIHGQTVVFCAEGDLWSVSDQGGVARRLSAHPGLESSPAFSPDGAWIAFSGQYDGNRDVFVMPAAGGEPRRLTWHPAVEDVLGWSPDGKRILFRSRAEEPHNGWEIYAVPAAGGEPEKLPVGWAGRLAIDPESGRYAFSRPSSETFTWKRYRGGTAAELWVGDPKLADFRKVTDFPGFDAYPMWHGGRVYFLSDQGGTADLWSMLPDGSDRRRLTDEGRWDARWPAIGPDGRIVYMLAGGLKLYDPATQSSRVLSIELPSERNLSRSRYSDAAQFLSGFSLAPEGDRLAIAARGELFALPVEDGVTLPVTRGSGAREEFPEYSPDGKRLLYVTDASGEEAIHSADAWGRGEVKILRPAGERGHLYAPFWSPDGKWIVYGDEAQNLWLQAVADGESVRIDSSDRGPIREYTFSPDSRWIAYTKYLSNDFGGIFLYDTQEKLSRRVTSPYTDNHAPAWDPEGKYLYFVSGRTMNPLFGSRDFTNVEVNNAKLYLTLLQADSENPFAHLEGVPPKAEAEGAKKDEGKGKAKKGSRPEKKDDKDKGEDDDEEKAPEPVRIDFAGIGERVVALDVPAGQYDGLEAIAGKLFYLSTPLTAWTEQEGDESPTGSLMVFDFESKEAEEFMGGVAGSRIAAKGEKMVVAKGPGELYVVGTGSKPDDLSEAGVSLDGVVIDLDPREEWAQIYHEAWRRMRDRYWDESMAGVDWAAMREQYAALLPLLAHRDDLGDLLGELIGELNTSHTYVWGGDRGGNATAVATGLLGADLAREGAAYRIARLYRGDEADDLAAPLLAPGVNLREGQYILAVNGLPFAVDQPFHASLEKLADKDVLLTVADDAVGKANRRDVVVTTLRSEGALRYADWVRRNREWVDQASGGKFGYVHIPDMGYSGMTTFDRWFYPQTDREGLIVDCRWNGGGFVSQILLERLRRPITAWDRTRFGQVETYPYRALNGPFVVLTNQEAGSDGDILPRAVQIEKLAPVIGMRSWGGVIGISDSQNLVDGGTVTFPYAAWWEKDGGWTIENHGVDPDIVIDNLPQEVASGKDSQLERGLTELTRLHQQDPPAKPDFGAIRSKARESYRRER